jgi:hypothetical protein
MLKITFQSQDDMERFFPRGWWNRRIDAGLRAAFPSVGGGLFEVEKENAGGTGQNKITVIKFSIII